MRLLRWFMRRLPDRDSIEGHRLLAWLGPRLKHPRLWHMNRRGIALGLAIGVFLGLIVPVAQIPLSVIAAVWLRANVPTAVASTLVTNPLTFAPIYWLAYQVGAFLLGYEVTAVVPQVIADRGVDVAGALPQIIAESGVDILAPVAQSGIVGWIAHWADRVAAAGKPLILGLLVFALLGSVLGYFMVLLSWRLRTIWQWRRRRIQRLTARRRRNAESVVREDKEPAPRVGESARARTGP